MQQSGDPLRIQVFNTLEDAILNGSYKEGDSLNELRLSKSLGVSRTPVREALMQLELEGLVKNIPNKGAVVVGISEQDVEDIYEIRIRIEGLAARLCAEKITDEELEELEELDSGGTYSSMIFTVSLEVDSELVSTSEPSSPATSSLGL